MVLPKEIRDKANIRAGDKLAVVSWEKDGKVCCLTLIRADELGGIVKNILGPFNVFQRYFDAIGFYPWGS
jgi:antitoxin PrlF